MPPRAKYVVEAGFSLIELVVALTLLALSLIGTSALMAGNNELFFKSGAHGRLQIAAQSILDDIEMRFISGTPQSDLVLLTANDWADLLRDNNIAPRDVRLAFENMGGLSAYIFSSYAPADRILRATTTTPPTPPYVMPQKGAVFLLGQSKIFCTVESASQQGNVLILTLGQGCNPSAVAAGTALKFPAMRAQIMLSSAGVTLNQARNFYVQW